MRKFILGSLLSITIFSLGVVASDNITEIIAQLRPDIKIYVDNEITHFENANGDDVYPILYNGTTYLPVRSAGEMMGKDVLWNADTNSIYLNEPGLSSSTVIYDKDNVKITFLGLVPNEKSTVLKGYNANLLIENNSDIDLKIYITDFEINGFIADPLFTSDVKSNSTAYDEITIAEDQLTKNSLKEIENFTVNFNFVNSSDIFDGTNSGDILVQVN